MLTIGLGASCQTGGQRGLAVDAPKLKEALRTRAECLWSAKIAQDWATVFEFLDPEIYSDSKPAEFVAWSEKNEPFRIQTYEVKSVETEQSMGWVQIDYTTAISRFPDLPPRDASMWEKWRHFEGKWFPVSEFDRDNYPEPPSRRDRAEERKLRERADQVWTARKNSDWHRLLGLVDPRDRDAAADEELIKQESFFAYRNREVQWVEAIGSNGQVRVTYTVKLTDPNLQRLPERDEPITEKWIKIDGTWYLDLKV